MNDLFIERHKIVSLIIDNRTSNIFCFCINLVCESFLKSNVPPNNFCGNFVFAIISKTICFLPFESLNCVITYCIIVAISTFENFLNCNLHSVSRSAL